MKVTPTNPGYLIECDRGLFRVAPPSVHNFRTSHAILRLEGERKRPRMVGIVVGGYLKGNPEAFAEQVVKADREWEEYLKQPHNEIPTNRTWVLNLDHPNPTV